MYQFQEFLTVLVAFYVACTGVEISTRAGELSLCRSLVWLFAKALQNCGSARDDTQQPCCGAGSVPRGQKPIVLLMWN